MLLTYIVRRLLVMIPTLIVASMLIFAVMELPPGNYFVRSDKPTDYATARKAVTVEAGKTSEVTLDLLRTPPKK